MERDEVLHELCALATEVGGTVFDSMHAHDCFCGEKSTEYFNFSPEVMNFIKMAVRDAIDKNIALTRATQGAV